MPRSNPKADALIRLLWSLDWPGPAIMEAIGSEPSRMHAIKARLCLSDRERSRVREVGRFLRKSDVSHADHVAQAKAGTWQGPFNFGKAQASRKAKPQATYPPGWSLKRDTDLLNSGGKHKAIADLANKWGMSMARVRGRWHVLRARR